MPNIKIFVEETTFAERGSQLHSALSSLRDLVCETLKVPVPACQFAVLPVMAMPDLPQVNVEAHIMPGPGRDKDTLMGLARQLQEIVGTACGTSVAVRIAQLDPATYLALK